MSDNGTTEVNSAADTYDLSIEFAGMCLFVRDPNGDVMHVLMPQITHAHTPEDEHLMRIFVHDRYIEQIENRQPGGTASGGWHPADISGHMVDLTQIVPESLGSGLSDKNIVHLTNYLEGRLVRRRFIQGSGVNGLAARVKLAAGQMGPVNRGARWQLKDCSHKRMAISGHWIIRGLRGPLTVRAGAEIWHLTPQGRRIEMAVFHAPRDEEPGTSPSTLELPYHVHHFKDYYPLFDHPGEEVPYDPSEVADSLSEKVELPPPFLGRRATCIMAQGEAEDSELLQSGERMAATQGSKKCEW